VRGKGKGRGGRKGRGRGKGEGRKGKGGDPMFEILKNTLSTTRYPMSLR